MIQVNSIQFSYRKSRMLFNDLSLAVKPGKIYGLLGSNGAGKTTLLKLVGGTLLPQKGFISLNGTEVSSRSVSVLQSLFYIPEEFLLPQISMKQFIGANASFYPRFDFSQMRTLQKDFDLPENEILTSLSYGQKKKFLIAFGIATNVPVLMLDEPTNGLDIPSKSQFRKIMVNAVTEDRTFIVSTHQVRDLATMLDHILMLDNGKIIFDHTSDDIRRCLKFGKTVATTDDVVYSEDTLGGKMAIFRNDGIDSEIDLELLFNGVLNNPKAINACFA